MSSEDYKKELELLNKKFKKFKKISMKKLKRCDEKIKLKNKELEEYKKEHGRTFFEVTNYDGNNYDGNHENNYYKFNEHDTKNLLKNIDDVKSYMLESINIMLDNLEDVCINKYTDYPDDKYNMIEDEITFYSNMKYKDYEKMDIEDIIFHAITISKIIYHMWPYGIKSLSEMNLDLEIVKTWN